MKFRRTQKFDIDEKQEVMVVCITITKAEMENLKLNNTQFDFLKKCENAMSVKEQLEGIKFLVDQITEQQFIQQQQFLFSLGLLESFAFDQNRTSGGK